MRVIAGIARGAKLASFPGREVRPTMDRVREALFNILAPRIEGASFLDLFAGTGANGIEALSRGATRADFVDDDPKAIRLIRENLEAAKLAGKAKVVRAALPSGLDRLSVNNNQYDILFADPPHSFADHAGLLDAIAGNRLLATDGVVCMEHARDTAPEAPPNGLERYRVAEYGKTALSFFRWPGI